MKCPKCNEPLIRRPDIEASTCTWCRMNWSDIYLAAMHTPLRPPIAPIEYKRDWLPAQAIPKAFYGMEPWPGLPSDDPYTFWIDSDYNLRWDDGPLNFIQVTRGIGEILGGEVGRLELLLCDGSTALLTWNPGRMTETAMVMLT